MANPKGNPDLAKYRPKGRKKGQKNKFTTIKATIEQAFAELNNGDPGAYLKSVAKREPGAFLAFVGRILPKQVEMSGPDKGPIIIRSNVHDD